MLDLFVASSEEDIQKLHLRPILSLGGPSYWYLHRYFVQASLAPGNFSFLNLYEDTEISGYQAHRLKSELKEALLDLTARPHSFLVLVGWSGDVRSAETEDWRRVDRAEVESRVNDFIRALTEAERLGHRVYAIGD